MKGGKTPLGYTIIEVMIVLAVSGVMFLIAASFINGKQERTAFTEGTNEMASQVQNVIEQVTDGQFSDIPLHCSFTFNGSVGDTEVTGGTNDPGTNSQCTFLGKLFSFSATSQSSYQIVSLAGGRLDVSSGVSPTLTNVNPKVITQLTTTQTVAQQLNVTKVTLTDPDGTPHTNYHNFGFLEGLGTASGGSFQSGAQTISLVYSPVTSSDLNSTGINGKLAYAKAASMCLTDGQRYAQILIGSPNGGDQLSVNIQVVPVC